jgi:enhancing lycopene biosynthesis protein 2
MKTFGVLLSGCGFYDGSDIWEAVLIHFFLEGKGYNSQFISLNSNAKEVINHHTQESLSEKRNIFLESARIGLDQTQNIEEVSKEKLEGLIIVGGFGLVKNFMETDQQGNILKVESEVKSFIRETFRRKKPIGGCGLASLLIASSLQDIVTTPLTLTLGNDARLSDQLEKLGAIHIIAKLDEAIIDKEHNIVTTPGNLGKHRIKEVASGIQNMILGVLELTQ